MSAALVGSTTTPTQAARPAYSVLSKEKIKTLGVQVPAWEESLAAFIAGME